jgi:methionyl-tRNA formyltransferase
MKVLLISCTRIGLKTLAAIEKNQKVNVVGIVTSPQLFSISYAPSGVKNIRHADFHEYANRKGIPLYIMKEKMSEPELIEFVHACDAQCLLVVGWFHIIPKMWLQTWPTFGIHGSLLPRYTGGAPLVWAMINGETETGTTLFKFEHGVDRGPIVSQRKVKIRSRDTIATLYEKVEKTSIRMLKKEIGNLCDPKLKVDIQDENTRTIFPQRSPSDGEIVGTYSEQDLRNFVRAQTKPYPGAFIELNGSRIVIWSLSRRRAQVFDSSKLIFKRKKNIYVSCTAGFIRVREFEIQQLEGTAWVSCIGDKIERMKILLSST